MELDDVLNEAALPDMRIDLDAAWRQLAEHAPARRRKRLVGAGAVLAVLLGAGAVGLTSVVARDDPLGVTSDDGRGAPPAADTWTPMARSPLSPRVPGVGVWTGEEMIVVGGSDATPCGSAADCSVRVQPLADGAAYDPASDSWRSIADAPVAFASGSATWTGSEVLVAVSSLPVDHAVHSLMSYDPANDEWTRRADPPASVAQSAWTGTEWVFVSQTSTGEVSDWKYLPKADRWDALPVDPIGRGSDREIVWTGDELILFASTFDEEGQPTNGFYQAAVLQDDHRAWRMLPLPRVVNNGNRWISAGDFVVNPTAGTTSGNDGQPVVFEYGGILDLRTETWEALGERPSITDPNPFSRTGYVGEADGWVVDDSFLFDPQSGRWHEVHARPDGVNPGAAVWTGTDILTWGGYSEADDHSSAPRLSGEGFAYRPPAR